MIHTHILSLCLLSCVLLVVGNVWLLYRVLIPLRRLARDADRLTEGDFLSLQTPVGGIQEIETVRYAMSCMVGHVRRAQSDSQRYAESLAEGQEAERTRLARDLHDDTVQALVAIGQTLELATQWIDSAPQQAVQLMQIAREQSVQSVQSLRTLIGALRPPALAELGLPAALEMLASRAAPLTFAVHIHGEPRRLPEPQELALFRIAQEGVSNAVRHSGGTQLGITLTYQPNGVQLSLTDDGQGFDVQPTLKSARQQWHFGLLGAQERANNLNGTLTVESTRSQGTTLRVWLPEQMRAQPNSTVQDPVCFAQIEPQQAYGSTVYEGTTYYFCCPVCQGAFQKDPTAYLS